MNSIHNKTIRGFNVKYANTDIEMKLGDIVNIDDVWSGRVVCIIEDGEFEKSYESFNYLLNGFMVETKEMGLIHYSTEDEEVYFVSRS